MIRIFRCWNCKYEKEILRDGFISKCPECLCEEQDKPIYEPMNADAHAKFNLRIAFCNPNLSPKLVSEALIIPLDIAIEVCSRVLASQMFGFDDEIDDDEEVDEE